MGSLHRSQHEFVYVFKAGTSAHINNIHWVAMASAIKRMNLCRRDSFGMTRDTDLAMHPTVKPAAMIADAILDASKPKGFALGSFAAAVGVARKRALGRVAHD